MKASIEHAIKNGISYKVEKNRFTENEEVVFFGSATDFFNQLSKGAFVQLTKPVGFNPATINPVGIEVAIPYNNNVQTIIAYNVNFK